MAFRIGKMVLVQKWRIDFGTGPYRWFAMDATRPWRNSILVTECLRHPWNAYHGLFRKDTP